MRYAGVFVFVFLSRAAYFWLSHAVLCFSPLTCRRSRFLLYPVDCHVTPWTLPCTLATGLRTGSGRRLIPWRGRSHRLRAASAGAGDRDWPRWIVAVGSLWVLGGQAFVHLVLLSPLAPLDVLERRVFFAISTVGCALWAWHLFFVFVLCTSASCVQI